MHLYIGDCICMLIFINLFIDSWISKTIRYIIYLPCISPSSHPSNGTENSKDKKLSKQARVFSLTGNSMGFERHYVPKERAWVLGYGRNECSFYLHLLARCHLLYGNYLIHCRVSFLLINHPTAGLDAMNLQLSYFFQLVFHIYFLNLNTLTGFLCFHISTIISSTGNIPSM